MPKHGAISLSFKAFGNLYDHLLGWVRLCSFMLQRMEIANYRLKPRGSNFSWVEINPQKWTQRKLAVIFALQFSRCLLPPATTNSH